jgi:GAF domain-containing protein
MRQLKNKLRNSLASDEQLWLENLKNYKIVYTRSEPVFDQLAALTAAMLDAPIALINFVDQEGAWAKDGQRSSTESSAQGGTSLCSLAINNKSEISFESFVKKPSLMLNPLIAGESGLQFYAAVPITTDDGFPVGMVCIVDKKNRKFLAHEQQKLEWVAGRVRMEMNKRMNMRVSA